MDMKKSSILTLMLMGIIGYALPASATVLNWNFNYEFSGAHEPEGAAPWLNATFDDGGRPGSVTLTMSDVNLVDAEHVKLWAFNLDPILDPTDLTITFSTGLEADSY
jgi:hypothetical protein